ncbi:cbb3-type cytochrome oxidase assembly protein CcoS [Membranihabitans maritimus]|uniref:cbb3-type cytochrome oxidase assembly protein CcoS n=1 Tax=Membranihabitans maritimus TaxID=2904244 RepID=UPI001F00ED64|nr:cbb3-type cytochrome oxidase assembly protein CcoS [Membranihabitans maritimus]
MSVIVILLSISVFIAAMFLLAFIWNVQSGQYEDDFSPPYRMLFDEDEKSDANSKISKNQN